MLIHSLALSQFRNYGHLKVDVHPSFNLFVGENGSGKSNLLEAIAYFYQGKSFRTAYQKALIRAGQEQAYLGARFSKEEVDHSIQIQLEQSQKSYRWNKSYYKSFKPLHGLLCGVSMSPDDQALIKGSPEKRRQFIDYLLFQCDPLYLYYSTRFNQAIKQRNAILKHPSKLTEAVIEPFEAQLSDAAAYIHHQRAIMVRKLEKAMLENTSSLLPSVAPDICQLELKYRSTNPCLDQLSVKDKQKAYKELYKQTRPQEIYQRTTLTGIHRDDVEIYSRGHLAKYYCSEGQIRAIIAAMKVSEWDLLYSITDQPPLSLVDDLGAFLDSQRQFELVKLLSKRGQLFITSTAQPSWLSEIESGSVFYVDSGQIQGARHFAV